MRTTVTLKDELFRNASAAAGSSSPSQIVNLALEALVQREAARRLAQLGGTDAHAKTAPRRRSEPDRTDARDGA